MPSSSFRLKSHARGLRRDQTDAEHVIWRHIRARQLMGAKFRRQFPIGDYIVDFCCYEEQLIVEIDGGQHTALADDDSQRTAYLESQGYTVLRFWNTDVFTNLLGVLQRIAEALGGSPEE